MTVYLADSSIWGWANGGRRPDIAARLASRSERDEIATCIPVALESLHRARTGAKYETLAEELEPIRWLQTDHAALTRAIEVQRSLAHLGHGYHRRSAIDFMIAATAELAGTGVTLWAFDRDMRVICEHTGQPCELEQAI